VFALAFGSLKILDTEPWFSNFSSGFIEVCLDVNKLIPCYKGFVADFFTLLAKSLTWKVAYL
jgi:hypothetical protein